MRYRNTAWIAAVIMALGAGMVLGQNTFDDVPDSDPRIEDIQYAAAQGWFQGYPDGSFRPDQEISEGQLAKVIRRARPGMTRGDAAVFIRAGIDQLQTVAPTTATAAPTTTAATTTTVRTGEPGGEGPAEPGSGGPVDPNPPVVIEPTTTTAAPAEATTTTTTCKRNRFRLRCDFTAPTTTTTPAATTTTVRTSEPGGEGPAEPGSGGPVDQNPPVVIEPTTTTTAPPTTTTTTTAPANTYYFDSRPVPAGAAAGVEAGRLVMRYGYEHGWTDSNGQSGSLFWFESYIRDYDVDVFEDRVLSFWAQEAENNVSFTPSDIRGIYSYFRTGWTGVHFILHRPDSLPPGRPDFPTDNTRMPRLHIKFVPFEIHEVSTYMWPLKNSFGPGRSTAAISSHSLEEVSEMPERAKDGAEYNGYSAPAANS